MGKTQDHSYLSFTTPLGPNALIVESFTGSEALSQPFHFEFDLLSEDPAIAFDTIVGQRVTLTIDVIDGTPVRRYVNGFVSRFVQRGADKRHAHYRAEVVPWLWFLSRNADCRIFQELSAPEIIKQLFNDRGMNDYEDRLEGEFPKLTYCVQYRERDISFVSRLMEEFGITYFFRHEKDRHVLVLANSKSGFEACAQQPQARYKPDRHAHAAEGLPGVVSEVVLEQELHTGKVTHSDYDFEFPSTNLRTAVPTRITVASNSRFELYDYPGRYAKIDQGEKLAKLRIEEEETHHQFIDAQSNCRAFMPGYRFDLIEHFRPSINQNYLLVRVEHVGVSGENAGASGAPYTNHFVAVPSEGPHRPQRRTPKPVVQGPQTAVVVGPQGEEIYTDKYGRVKVQFHWDRLGTHDAQSSAWVRVSQHWAGSQYGSMFIPRLGQEVIVDFLEGDPDQPIITGRVYNAEQMPPYALPAERTKSGFKTNSSKGGDGYNELCFEDKKGAEQIIIHAQKDFNETVEHNHSTTVKVDQTNTVQGNQTETVTKNQTITVSQGKRAITVSKGNQSTDIAVGHCSTKVAKSFAVTAGSDVVVHSTGATLTAQGKANVTVVSDENNLYLLATKAEATLQGKTKAMVYAKEIEIAADSKITLSVGGNKIVIDASGIAVNGTKITSEATGPHVIKGSVVKIN